jgi:hypothetical protein
MLSEYFRAALGLAQYERLEDGTWAGTIPGFAGLLGSGGNRDSCEQDLASALEDWTLLGLQLGHPLPVVGDLDLNLQQAA